jgi:hypothetical protein
MPSTVETVTTETMVRFRQLPMLERALPVGAGEQLITSYRLLPTEYMFFVLREAKEVKEAQGDWGSMEEVEAMVLIAGVINTAQVMVLMEERAALVEGAELEA